ncbi:hypothetical protein AJ79_02670 [Helicocarpus griseus UAMH5409]|uniref:Zn(2)-C6 fungal-type domain-containing protein n=1 Tax=Helicocarpus griseus UAMH5409 TaxID=1447875 RepID=A0A2B7Y129_9EURO|nr:hypothetical protein AJ79_02670 [Helicocarpus griseus UAMH5409]
MAGFECTRCGYRFTQKSSLVRHSKRCADGRPQSLRQKACRECSAAKTRCDLKRPACSRCEARRTACQYPSPSAPYEPTRPEAGSGNYELPQYGSIKDTTAPCAGVHVPLEQERFNSGLGNHYAFPTPESACMDLPSLLPPDLEALESSLSSTFGDFDDFDALNDDFALVRHMHDSGGDVSNQLVPSTQPAVPAVSKVAQNSTEMVFRVTRTWPRMMAKGTHLPPMIHPNQLSDGNIPTPLANCFALVQMWDGQRRGATGIVQQTVKKEVQAIVNLFPTFDERNMTTALQALTIYTILLLFPSNEQQTISRLDDKLVRQLESIIHYVVSTGIVLEEESNRVRPLWECWVHVTCKRRAVLSLYTIFWAYCVYHSIPPLDCRDASHMPAPAPKYLWQATTREQWESLYNRWLAQWDGPYFRQDELLKVRSGARMGFRAELWLEDADEFGMMYVFIRKFLATPGKKCSWG